ncbi:pyridoxal phosphate-dependent aminotransferase [Maribellus maritimus]|uniref:pyridoxal phosphate-dependent aminotransferase n=1 Tax=Maribellus maritimus TaxID=2870838 RepID=UPI001EECE7BB|nr:aminotransferase class I/II-fold pyridoxal phosphate-dependent enzyme [Maribellus maritimus]MCG6187167.1 aminotransferase class I/II-fold pyridoxal phosphate-dependent enzyme [Maribellus maritimus]
MGEIRKSNHFVNLNLNVRGLSQSATLVINERSNELIQQGKKVYKLGLGQSPFPVPKIVQEALQRNAYQKDYLPVKGLMKLREAIAAFNYRHEGTLCSPEDIMIGPGSKELIFILQLVYYGELIIPTPSWVSYSPQARIAGRHVTWVPTSEVSNWRLSPEKLDLICRSDPDRPRVVILNYPSNPTGSTYPEERLKKLAEVARKYNLILISDEIYGLLDHEGNHISISRYYPEGTIISSGLSKWAGAGGWRLGTFTFPENLRWLQNAMAIVASETFTSTSAPIQYAAITAFEEHKEIDEYLVYSRKILKALGNYMTDRLRAINITLPSPKGGFYLFPNFNFYREKLASKGILTSFELCEAVLKDTGVAFLPGMDFGRQPEELTCRMAYVDFDGEMVLDKAMNDFKDKPIDNEFLKSYCPKMIKSIDLLEEWLENL